MSDADETMDETVDDELASADEDEFEADAAGDAEDPIFDGDDDVLGDEDVLGDDESSEDDEDDSEAAVPLDISEDGDDEFDGQPAVDLAAIEGLEVDDPAELAAEEAEDVDADDAIREGEFVCRACHMAKRSSALADPDEMLCRDCV